MRDGAGRDGAGRGGPGRRGDAPHVVGRADDGAGQRALGVQHARDAEVGELDDAAGAVQEDVARLEVAVQHAALVAEEDGARELAEPRGDELLREEGLGLARCLDGLLQVAAVAELEQDVQVRRVALNPAAVVPASRRARGGASRRERTRKRERAGARGSARECARARAACAHSTMFGCWRRLSTSHSPSAARLALASMLLMLMLLITYRRSARA